MLVTHFQPIALGRAQSAFTHQDWRFEIKWDGFRALARIEHGRCKLVSRNGNEFKSFPDLNLQLPKEIRSESAVLDGEIVCLDKRGKAQFRDLLFHKGQPRFVAFDLLWTAGEDLRLMPLIERKFRLRSIISKKSTRLIYCDHVEENGGKLFKLACKKALEGVVAKHKYAPYIADKAQWLKIRNQSYSQWAGREKLFEHERDSNADFGYWDACVLACPE